VEAERGVQDGLSSFAFVPKAQTCYILNTTFFRCPEVDYADVSNKRSVNRANALVLVAVHLFCPLYGWERVKEKDSPLAERFQVLERSFIRTER
jgi:hypothetical protein